MGQVLRLKSVCVRRFDINVFWELDLSVRSLGCSVKPSHNCKILLHRKHLKVKIHFTVALKKVLQWKFNAIEIS